MRLINDKSISLGWIVNKVHPPQFSATFLLKGTFVLRADAAAIPAAEPALLTGDVYAEDNPLRSLIYPSDFAPFKPRADTLMLATAHTPNQRLVTSLQVRVKIGPMVKTLVVFGPRTWHRRLLGRSIPSAPRPFMSVPITYENAFGGSPSKHNPVGRGLDSDDLPQVENPRRLVASRGANLEPVGFGPLAPTWGDRKAMLGTYDATWEQERWPWFPEDFDWGYFNSAPRDQQLEGYLRGDEALEFENLHPQHPVYRSRLPGVRPRCFLNERLPYGDMRFREVPVNLDTLWIDMDKEMLILVWRGLVDVRTLTLKEIEHIVTVMESLSEPPKSLEHYRATLLAPPALPPVEDREADAREEAEFEAQLAEMDKRFAQAEQEFAQAEQEIGRYEADANKALAEQKAALIAAGIDATRLEESSDPQTLAEVQATSAASLADLKTGSPEEEACFAQMDMPDLRQIEQEIQALEKEMEEVRQEVAAMLPPKLTRESVQAMIDKGEVLAHHDLSELDLSEIDFTNANLTGALFSKANLRGAKLAKTNLSKADLTGADITGADLTGAILDEADLSQCIVSNTKMIRLSLSYATLSGLDLKGADFSGSTGIGADFSRADLAEAQFVEAKLGQADFSASILTKANFCRAELPGAGMQGVQASELNMEEADLSGLQASSKSVFISGNFKKVQGHRSVWEEAVLDGADFSRALLNRAQFGESSLEGANFDRADLSAASFDDANLRGAVLTNANVLRATFDRADLTGVTVAGSNFYEAGFWETVIERARFREANVKSTLLG